MVASMHKFDWLIETTWSQLTNQICALVSLEENWGKTRKCPWWPLDWSSIVLTSQRCEPEERAPVKSTRWLGCGFLRSWWWLKKRVLRETLTWENLWLKLPQSPGIPSNDSTHCVHFYGCFRDVIVWCPFIDWCIKTQIEPLKILTSAVQLKHWSLFRNVCVFLFSIYSDSITNGLT